MKTSILLAALDPGELRRTVDDVLATAGDAGDYEIVVCAPFAFEAPRTRFVAETQARGPAWAYNLAADAARGDVLVHITDGKAMRAGWLAASLACLAERDKGGPAFVACLPMHDPSAGDAFVGTVMGRLYPWYFATHRRTVELLGPYFDPAYKGAFGDTDFGMRVWSSGGRCEIVPGGARYGMVPSARVRPPSTASLEAHAADFRVFLDRWYPLYGAGYGVKAQPGRVDVAPWNVCYDVPSLFFDHFVREGTIVAQNPDFPRTGAFLRAAATLVRVEGRTMPPDVAADPRRVPDWVQAIAAEKGAV